MNQRLYRSRADRMVAGVAGGIAELLNVDPSLVRIVWVLLVPLTGGLIILLYVVMAVVVPEPPIDEDRWAARDRPWPDPWTEGQPPIDEPGPPTAPDDGARGPGRPAGPWPPGTADRPPVWRGQQRPDTDRGVPLIVGLILVLIGVFLLARMYVPDVDWDAAWPFLLVGIGVALVLGALRRPPRT